MTRGAVGLLLVALVVLCGACSSPSGWNPEQRVATDAGPTFERLLRATPSMATIDATLTDYGAVLEAGGREAPDDCRSLPSFRQALIQASDAIGFVSGPAIQRLSIGEPGWDAGLDLRYCDINGSAHFFRSTRLVYDTDGGVLTAAALGENAVAADLPGGESLWDQPDVAEVTARLADGGAVTIKLRSVGFGFASGAAGYRPWTLLGTGGGIDDAGQATLVVVMAHETEQDAALNVERFETVLNKDAGELCDDFDDRLRLVSASHEARFSIGIYVDNDEGPCAPYQLGPFGHARIEWEDLFKTNRE